MTSTCWGARWSGCRNGLTLWRLTSRPKQVLPTAAGNRRRTTTWRASIAPSTALPRRSALSRRGVGTVADKVRFYLKRVSEFAAHGLKPVEYRHIEVEVPALAAILRSKTDYPWFVVGVEVVEERDDDD